MNIKKNAQKNVLRNRGRNILLACIIFVIAVTAVILILKPFSDDGNSASDIDSQYPNNAGYVDDVSEYNQQDTEQNKSIVEPDEDGSQYLNQQDVEQNKGIVEPDEDDSQYLNQQDTEQNKGIVEPDEDSNQYPNNAGYIDDGSEDNQQNIEQNNGVIESDEGDNQYANNGGYVDDKFEYNQQEAEQNKGAVEPGEDMSEIGAIRKLIVKGKTVYRRDNNGVAEYSYDEGETWTTTRPDQ